MNLDDAQTKEIFESLHALVVDDQGTMRKILRQLLHQQHINNVAEAESGEEALKYVQNHMNPNPDFIICDLYMEGMDGMEFVHKMRRSKSIIPILILTGEKDEFMLIVTKQAGATTVLTKPISAPDLAHEVGKAIGLLS